MDQVLEGKEILAKEFSDLQKQGEKTKQEFIQRLRENND